MNNNHIIIGLGGTGGKVIRAFRKILWEECRNLEARFKNEQTGMLSEPVANIAYLYADSNQADLDGADGQWEIFGESLKLDTSEKVLLSDESGGSALLNKKQFPSVSGWIGNTEILQPLVRESRALTGCNQIRRFGRYVFAQNAGSFMQKVAGAEAKLQNMSGENRRTFHICCTLGCGTGSGSLIDAVSQIRKRHPIDVKDNPIFLYCLLNSELPGGSTVDVGYFYQNQFAVLSELNALGLTIWKPHDVMPDTNNEPRLDGLQDHFQTCFLISPNTQDNQYADKDAQEEMIASYLYQKIVPLRADWPEVLQKAESSEDVKANKDDDRCARFASLGIKRYRIPEEEIREKLSFTFCKQAVLQVLFNTLLPGGYAANPRGFVAGEWASKPENQERWCLTDAHLMLSTDFSLAGGKAWPSISDDWAGALRKKKESLIKFKNKAKQDRQTWLTEMMGFSTLYYERNFRDSGVDQFYKSKREALSEYARAIRSKIETHLFEQWRVGEHSLTETDQILKEILSNLTKRKEGFDKRIADGRKAEEYAVGRMREAEANWIKINWLTVLFGDKQENLLGAYTVGLTDKNVAQTDAVASNFAKDLLQQIIDQLGESKRRLAEVTKMFTDLRDTYQEEIDKRISDKSVIGPKKNQRETKLVDQKEIAETISALQAESTVQIPQCAEVRTAIASSLGIDGNERTFTTLAQKTKPILLENLIYATCDRAAETYHTIYFNKQRDAKKILGRNIVEKLYDKTQGDLKQLDSVIKELVQSASAYMKFNTQIHVEAGKLIMPQERLVIFIPEGGDVKFSQELAKAFEKAYNVKPGSSVTNAPNKNNPKEILLISVSFFFEVRFIQPLVNLRDKYETFLKTIKPEDEIRGVHLIHLENHRHPIKDRRRPDGIKGLPSLYPEETTDNDYFNYVLLGMAIGWIVPEENKDGTNVLQYSKRNAKGRPLGDLIDLNSLDPIEAAKQLTRATYMKLKAEIDGELSQFYSRTERKELLKSKFSEILDAKYEERQRKSADPVYQAFQKGVQDIESRINDIV